MKRTEGQRLWKVRRLLTGSRDGGRVRDIWAESRDEAALYHARVLFGIGQVASVRHEERGWYTVVLLGGLERYRTMRVYAAKATARRGVDEQAARSHILRALHPETQGIAVRELAMAEGGRADLVVVPADGTGPLHGYEIKTEKDSLARLSRQALEYGGHFAHLSLATTPRHMEAARELLPASWGLVELDAQTHAVTAEVRPCTPLSETIYTPAETLLLELWKSELLDLLRKSRLPELPRKNKWTLRRLVLDFHGEEEAGRQAQAVLLARPKANRVTAVKLPLGVDDAW